MYSKISLTRKQAKILEFIREVNRENGGAPTYREIAARFGFKSPKAAVDHVRALEKKGYVHCRDRRARGIELLVIESASTEEAILVPILGNIPAGQPEEQTEQRQGTFVVDQAIIGDSAKHRLFVLQTEGESMYGRGIHDGDWIVADAEMPFREGDVVVALIDGENTLKTLAKHKGRFFLKAENPDHLDWVPMREMMIQGVVKAVLRRI